MFTNLAISGPHIVATLPWGLQSSSGRAGEDGDLVGVFKDLSCEERSELPGRRGFRTRPTLYTLHSTLYTVHFILLHTSHSTLHTPHFTLDGPTADSKIFNITYNQHRFQKTYPTHIILVVVSHVSLTQAFLVLNNNNGNNNNNSNSNSNNNNITTT